MPRNPKATRPNANTGAAIMVAAIARPIRLKKYATDISATMVRPSQYAEKFPATKPERIPSDAPPSFAEVTTSFTCRESTDVKAFTNSGITAPANVPQEIIEASFHHCEVSPPRVGMMRYETAYVAAIETIDVIQTSDVNGVSKFILSALPYLALAIALLMKYARALATSIMMRITNIQTSN